MNRETFSLLAFSLLAMVAVNGSYHWMESHQTLDSKQALSQAQKAIRHSGSAHGERLRLAKVIPPAQPNAAWRFEYKRAQGNPLTVTVQENGHASLR